MNLTPFATGFRPFFLGAAVLAISTMVMWMGVYLLQWPIRFTGISTFHWHAHEMIFGYAMAVIAGFLLTAARSWTGQETLSGAGLGWLFAVWVLARLLMLAGTQLIIYAAIADIVFMLALIIAVARPIVKVRQKRQAPVLLLLVLLLVTNVTFYLGAAGLLNQGAQWGVYGGLYLVLGIILFMGSRVIPFFTKGGVNYPVDLKSSRWNDIGTFILYPLFAFAEIFFPHHPAGALLAAGLVTLNSIRVSGWHTLGIWQKPLLWGLFAAFIMINLGFLLRTMSLVTGISPFLAIHAFAVGGVGIITISMMARVALGHTGRDVHQAPPVVTPVLISMVLATTVRVFLPLFDPAHYQLWITISATLWIISYALFAGFFIPILLKPRADGKPG
ncbi:MAG: NnrS family protein [Xanthomonadales bacterium]